MEKQAVDKHANVYEPGTVLFREGEPGNKIYVLNEGRVKLLKRVHSTEILIEVLGPGEFCGELALLSEAVHPVTAVVLEPAKMLIVDAQQFEKMVRGNAEIALRMMRKLAGRLTEAQFRISNFALRDQSSRLMHQLSWEVSMSEDGRSPLLLDDLAEVLAMDRPDVDRLVDKLAQNSLIQIHETGDFSIPDIDAFDQYLTYLELKDRYSYLA